MLGLASSLVKGGASLLTYVKDNLKLYLDFKSSRSDTLAFPSDGSTSFTNTTGEHIDCGTQIATDLGGSFNTAFTVSFWLYRTVTNNSCGMFYIGTFANANGLIQIYTYNDILKFRINNVDQLDIADFSSNNSGWNHIAFTWNASITTSTVYINGVAQTPKTNSSSSIAFTSSMKTIIGNYYGEGFPLLGKMANVGFWTRALSPEEVQSVMNKSYSQLGSVEKTSLVMWQSLDSANNAIGNELTTNSGFDTDTGWTKETGWTIDETDGVAVANNAGATYTLYQTASSTIYGNKTYRVTYTITEFTSSPSGMKIRIGGSLYGTARTAVGTYTEDITTNSSIGNQGIGFYSTGANNTLKIDNVSFKELNMSEDSHGNNHGTSIGATTTTSVYGGNAPILPRAIDITESQADKIGNGSASFNGSSDFVQIEDSSILDVPKSWTLSAWIKIGSGTSGYDRIIGKQDTSNNCNYGMGLQNGNELGIFFNDGGGFDVQYYTTDLDVGEWYHGVGTWDGTYLKVYLNGILVASSSDISSSASSAPNSGNLLIGVNAINGGENFKGNIAGVGVWQGALNQAQIQSVMESTSYAKIPASVKSNLGSELISANTTSEWNQYGSPSHDPSDPAKIREANTDNGVALTAGSDLRNAYRFVSGLTDGKLYKLNVDAYYSGSSDTPQLAIIPGSGTLYTSVLTTTSTNYSIYFVKNSGAMYVLGHGVNNGNVLYVENLSIKEVTNDLVAYYPLDADSSRGNGTDDVTTGEVLGGELIENGVISTNQFTLNPAYDAGTGKGVTIDNGTLRIRTAGNTSVYIEDNNLFESGALYKIVAVVSDATSGALYFRGGNVYVTNQASTVGTHIIYLKSDGTNFIIARNTSTVDISISSLSVKKVTSNTGVLL